MKYKRRIFEGVYWKRKVGMWAVYVRRGLRSVFCGYYSDMDDAVDEFKRVKGVL